MKCAGLPPIFIYIVFKFAWAYRLFNNVAILFGAMQGARGADIRQARHSSGRKILRSKGKVNDLPLAVTVARQHRVGLA